jgi:CheY-like chemotaxis protein
MKDILIVDDDSTVLDVLSRTLRGYRVWVARDPDEALVVAGGLAGIDLVITDYMMPSMTGEELVGRLRSTRPRLKVLFVTGHAAIFDKENPDWWAREKHLPKPVEIQRVRDTVAELIGPPGAQAS